MGQEITPVQIDNVDNFLIENEGVKLLDISQSQIKELKEVNFSKDIGFEILNIYFPNEGKIVKMLDEQSYFNLRTNRNRNLINTEEQKKLYDSKIGITGLSVGSGIAIELQYQGISKNLNLAEFDDIETTNLNRMKASVFDIGKPKINYTQEKVYEINPYANIKTFDNGIDNKNVEKFIEGLDVAFEIIDDFYMKVVLRIEAKKQGVPVIMAANLGDSVLVDVERFDLDKNLPLFHGILGDFVDEVLENPEGDNNQYAVKIVGKENVPARALESVKLIGKELVGRPQLSSTVSVSSAVCTYLARKIILGDKTISGRYKVDLNNIFSNG